MFNRFRTKQRNYKVGTMYTTKTDVVEIVTAITTTQLLIQEWRNRVKQSYISSNFV